MARTSLRYLGRETPPRPKTGHAPSAAAMAFAPGPKGSEIRYTGAPPIAEQIARRVCGEGGTGYTLGVATPSGPKLMCLPGTSRKELMNSPIRAADELAVATAFIAAGVTKRTLRPWA